MAQQLALYRGSHRTSTAPVARPTEPRQARPRRARTLCAGCRAKEARYGFRSGEEAGPADRPRTLCFDCFRMELSYREAIAQRLSRGWNGTQADLPLAEKLAGADRQRRRAQIAARHALGL
ncbi:MAG: hypothetical protein ABL986_01830 [Vicinamibacterales bacterium]